MQKRVGSSRSYMSNPKNTSGIVGFAGEAETKYFSGKPLNRKIVKSALCV